MRRASVVPALVLGLACWVPRVVRGQGNETLEPQWLRLGLPPGVSVGMEAEGLRETMRSRGSESTHDRFSLVPLVGLKLDGSVYHPNLMSFTFDGEGGWGPAYDSVKGPGYSQTRNEEQRLGRYVAEAYFLQNKPYTASLFASQDHSFRDFDFFNTAVVDSSRYGGRASYVNKSLNLSLEAGHRDESTESLSGTSQFADSYVAFNGQQQREHGITTMLYNYDEFSRLDYFSGSTGSSHTVSASDSETFGARDHMVNTVGGGYSRFNFSEGTDQSYNLSENFEAEHLHNLKSYLRLNFDENEFNPASTTLFQGIAGVRHKLYENLRSDFDVHGSYQEFDSPTGQGQNTRYGVGLHEDYYRNISESLKLSLGGSVVADHEDHESDGAILSSINERHTLRNPAAPGFTPTYLNNPRVIQSSVVARRADGVALGLGIDYILIRRGELTEIQMVPTSVLITGGSVVLVSYESASLYTSSFESLNSGVQIRLDILRIFGVYARANWMRNNAPADVLVETLTDYVGGVDFIWRGFRAGAEYEDYTSSFTSFDALRFFESYSFRPEENSTIGIDFSQIFYTFADGRDENQYQFILRFDTRLVRWLSWNVEGGYFLHDIAGTTQNLGAARTGFDMSWGKLTLRTGYQYNYQINQGVEERVRNFAYLYVKRVF